MIVAVRSPFFKRALTRRILAYLLLLPMIYAISFGSAHSHGSLAGQSGDGFAASTAQIGTVLAGPFRNPAQGSECLLCVFHKQLFNTAIPDAIFAAQPEVQVVSSSVATVVSY